MKTTPLPCYTYSVPRFLIPALRVLFGVRSSISRDAALLLKGAHPAPRALNVHHIPPTSPFLLVVNHYDHPGLGAWWGVATIAAAIAAQRTREPRDIRFMMTREWWYPPGLGRLVKQPLTRWFFGKISKTYGMILLPPVLGNNEFRGEGTLAIRGAVALTRGDPPALLGVAPEGKTGDNLTLCQPPIGAGLFLLLLTRDTIPVLPCGIFEDDNTRTLTVNFGAPFQLNVPRRLPKAERDGQAARQAMVHIGALLPERMWGVYYEEIKALFNS